MNEMIEIGWNLVHLGEFHAVIFSFVGIFYFWILETRSQS